MKDTLKTLSMTMAALFALASCETIVDLDTDQGEELLVVEAFISQKDTAHYVRLSRSGDFYVADPNARLIDPDEVASVSVAEYEPNDELVRTVNFLHQGQGRYEPVEQIIGQDDYRYDLEIVMANGDVYSASETMQAIDEISDACYRIDDREEDDPEEEGYFYEVRYYSTDAQDEDNHYLFKPYRNDTLQNNDGQDVYVADDDIIGEELNGFSGPVYYRPGDESKLEIMGLSRRAFVFYDDLGELLQNDGGMFNGIPANPRTNILKNGKETTEVFGVFQVSWVSEYYLVIGQDGAQCDF